MPRRLPRWDGGVLGTSLSEAGQGTQELRLGRLIPFPNGSLPKFRSESPSPSTSWTRRVRASATRGVSLLPTRRTLERGQIRTPICPRPAEVIAAKQRKTPQTAPRAQSGPRITSAEIPDPTGLDRSHLSLEPNAAPLRNPSIYLTSIVYVPEMNLGLRTQT